MRVTTVFRKLLDLQTVRVVSVEILADALAVIVDVRLKRRGLTCSRCGRRHRGGAYDTKVRKWRHLDFGPWGIFLRAGVRRFRCTPCDAVVTEVVSWAEVGSQFTRDFEDVAAYLAQQTSKTVVSRKMKIAWPTVGKIIERTVRRRGMPLARRRLYHIGIDEISYRKHHKYLTLVADHVSGDIVWGGDGKSGATLDGFLDELGDEGRQRIELVSMDMSQAYISKVRERLPDAAIVFDPFHVIKLANHAVDETRREQVRALKGQAGAQGIKKTRWLLLKANENLGASGRRRLSHLARVNQPLYRAYLLKEALRDVYTLPPLASPRLDAWLAWASRSRLPAFIKLAATVRQHRAGILASIEHGLSNGRLEGLNSKVRLLSHRAFGFHSADALLALVYLCCSGITVPLPSDRRPSSDPHVI
jgi:transposase